MERRSFLGRVIGLVAAALGIGRVAPTPAPLAFHRDAFAMVMEPLSRRKIEAPTFEEWMAQEDAIEIGLRRRYIESSLQHRGIFRT